MALLGALGASSIIGGLASTIGATSATSASNKLANATNLKIARETNQANREIADATNAANLNLANKQNEWNIDQWNRENDYNSPLSQLQRLQSAGINPNGILTAGSSSTGLTSANLANQVTGNPMQSATMQPMDYSQLSTGVNNAINAYSSLRLAESTSAKQSAETKAIESKLPQELQLNGSLMTFQELRNKDLMQQNEFFAKRYLPNATSSAQHERNMQAYAEAGAKIQNSINSSIAEQKAFEVSKQCEVFEKTMRQLDLNIESTDISNKINTINLEWLPKEKQVEIRSKLSQIASMDANTQLTQQTTEFNAQNQPFINEGLSTDVSTKKAALVKLRDEVRSAFVDQMCGNNPELRSILADPKTFNQFYTLSRKMQQYGTNATYTAEEKRLWNLYVAGKAANHGLDVGKKASSILSPFK